MKTVRSLFGIVISIFFVMSFITQAWSLEPGAEKQKVVPVPRTEGLKEPMLLLPDLVIEKVEMMVVGDPKREVVFIRNIGAAMPAGWNWQVRVQIYVPDYHTGSKEIFNKVYTVDQGLSKGERRSIYVDSPIPLGTGGVCNCLQRITVDPDNWIKESNENNNIYVIDSYLH